MYCYNCGIKLENTEKNCPLCGKDPLHPVADKVSGNGLYPKKKYPSPDSHSLGLPILATALIFICLVAALLCDLRFSRAVTWSGYVIGALVLGYVILVLPLWFRAPNPVIFVPCGFAAAGLYLLYINLATQGDWFISFALPITAILCLIISAIVTLFRYIKRKRGRLFICGGAAILTGAVMPIIELLLHITFDVAFVGWSFYPMISLALIGGLFIFIGICRPAREVLERQFFF